MPTKPLSFQEKFWSYVKIETDTVCWPWIGCTDASGYGQLRENRDGKTWLHRAHRVSWEIHFGKIPQGVGYHGTVVRHKCDNPKCVNPRHLEIGTQKENLHDCEVRGRKNNVFRISQLKKAFRCQCRRGHLKTLDNVYTYTLKSGETSFRCRTCRLERNTESKKRKALPV